MSRTRAVSLVMLAAESVLVISVVMMACALCSAIVESNREVAKQHECAAHLRKIYRALEMYKAAKGAYPSPDVGLYGLVSAGYLREDELICPDDPRGPERKAYRVSSYGYQVYQPAHGHSWSSWVKNGMSNFPMVFDSDHMTPEDRALGNQLWIVLRGNGSVQYVRGAYNNSEDL